MALTEDQIRLCYEVVLGRTADASGLAHYLRVARAKDLNTLHSIAQMLYVSDEFRSRFGSGTVVDIFGQIKEVEYEGLRLQLPENDAIYREISTTNSYEPYLSRHLFSNVRPGCVFVDIGANLGVLSLPVAKRAGESGRVLAFEASPRNANLLIKNAIINKLANVDVYPIGLSDQNGAVLSHVSLHTSNKALVDLPPAQLRAGMEIIPVVTLDSFIDRQRRIDIMKIDVEGFEYKVLVGSLETISKWRPQIYLEYSDAFQRSGSGVPGAKLLELLLDLDYAPTILHRTRSPEAVLGDKASRLAAVDGAWAKCVDEGGTHLDLYWQIGP